MTEREASVRTEDFAFGSVALEFHMCMLDGIGDDTHEYCAHG